MVLGWRKAFCTSIPKDREPDSKIIIKDKSQTSLTSRFNGFFSTPSTPRQTPPPNLRCKIAPPNAAHPTSSAPQSPKLQCKTRDSPNFFHRSSPSSPRSPFSLLKSSLRLSKSRCGICLERVKTGQGTAIFTAECGHRFHFPCIGGHVTKQGSPTCPICSSNWKDMPILPSDHELKPNHGRRRGALKAYNDDESLLSPTSGGRFNPIPESDETEEENEEFPGFYATVPSEMMMRLNRLEIDLLPEAAVVSVGKSTETYAVVLKIKAPAAPMIRAPIDLVTVLNVSRSITADKLHLMKKAMRLIVSSLSAADRLSIVAFSTTSKRLLPLRRMTTAGRRSARRIIDAIVALDGGASCAADSLKKVAKVIEDRREENPTTSVILFSDSHRGGLPLTSATFPGSDIPFHTFCLSACLNAPDDDKFAKSVVGLLSVVVQDLQFQLGFKSGSSSAEISAVYSRKGKPQFLGSGSSLCRVGDLHSREVREFLIELKVPSFGGTRNRQLSIRCSYKDPSTQQPKHDKERLLALPRPRAVGSSTRDVKRLRCVFLTTRALAESRRLAESNDEAGARHMLASARALILQTGSDVELVQRLEVELAELTWKRKDQLARRSEAMVQAEPLTPVSAWKAAERLAKVAILRKSLNRVSDLHGFENAGF
ncbi:hypothetical protein CASFOL_018187 [Castilleja foliolosa]|uniref:Zinc finger family protein n=1 Tax=Castilleja foliolosa TaxID=1961234 RepID=A0ABD3D7C2_9LAMI